jgi:branched-subunit amino acid aminotransferase/4-amino-4-deoxychorismate lyase
MVRKLEVDGHEPSVEELQDAVLSGYGHFTAMQVRGGRVRGLALHLARLDAANRATFGRPLDGVRVRSLIRHALDGGPGDASVRVLARERGDGAGFRVLVLVRPPFEMPQDASQKLKSTPYLRPVPEIKRPGDFAHAYYIDRAVEAGFDDALLVGSDGLVAESGIANIAFFDGRGVLWPDAPQLAGITMQLVAPLLAERMPARTAKVLLADVPSMAGAVVTNSRGIAAVTHIDEVELPAAPEFVDAVEDAYESVPWDEI